MKQFILLLFALLVGRVATFGQDLLDFRMCDVYKGKVKSINITSPEMMKSETVFSPDGKIKYMKNSTFSVDYEWKSNEELKLSMSTAQAAQNIYIYINEYRKDFYDYDIGEANVKIWFRESGSLDKKELTSNGNKVCTTYFYHTDSDLYPYKIENRMGTQSQIMFVNVEECDAEGNAIVFSTSCNGIIVQQKRTITYYE